MYWIYVSKLWGVAQLVWSWMYSFMILSLSILRTTYLRQSLNYKNLKKKCIWYIYNLSQSMFKGSWLYINCNGRTYTLWEGDVSCIYHMYEIIITYWGAWSVLKSLFFGIGFSSITWSKFLYQSGYRYKIFIIFFTNANKAC